MDVLAELEKLRLKHYECEDRWYSCPLSDDGCGNEAEGNECNCVAEKHNAILDGIIQHLKAAQSTAAKEQE